jgi:hypothetical protein
MQPIFPGSIARVRWSFFYLLLVIASGCKVVGPAASTTTDWSPDQAVLASADFHGDRVTVHHIRNCVYRSTTDYTVRDYDRTFDLNDLQTVDFVVCPFGDSGNVAHTFLTFGFGDGSHLGISAEARRKRGEDYGLASAMSPHFPLVYIIGDERDLIGYRTNFWNNDVYIYRAKSAPAETRKLFVSMLTRANALQHKPEYYNLLTNNCTTNLRDHINEISPGRVPYSREVLLPAFSDHLAYELGLIDDQVPFERLKMNARVNPEAFAFRDAPDFSQRIRK